VSFQWGSEGGVTALWFGSTRVEEGSNRRGGTDQRRRWLGHREVEDAPKLSPVVLFGVTFKPTIL
jgi:hypothetical protein